MIEIMIDRIFVIPRAGIVEFPVSNVTLTGPETDTGLRSPPPESLNQGTIRLPGNGDARILQCDLCICLPKSLNDEPWTFAAGITDLIDYSVQSEDGTTLVQKFLPAPSMELPIADGGRVFRAGKYGLYSAPFPESISFEDGKPVEKRVSVEWKINPKYGSGALRVYLKLNGANHGIIPSITWQLL